MLRTLITIFIVYEIPLTSEHKEQLEKSGVHDLESELVSYAHTGAFIEQDGLSYFGLYVSCASLWAR